MIFLPFTQAPVHCDNYAYIRLGRLASARNLSQALAHCDNYVYIRLGRLASARNLSQALAHCDNYDPWKHEFYFNYRHRKILFN